MIWLADAFMWCWCWVAYWLVILLPLHHKPLHPVWNWLLPYAGFYGFHDPSWMTWRWSGRVSR